MEHDKLIALANEAVLKFKRANELKAAIVAANPPPNPN